MFNPNSSGPGDQASIPPLISAPPPLPAASQKSGLSPLAITAICVAAVGTVLGAVVLIAGTLGSQWLAKSRNPQTRHISLTSVGSEASPATARVAVPATATSEDGLTYWNEKVPSEPWSIHVLKIDRSRKDLGFFTPHARNRVLAVSILEDQVQSVPPDIGRAVAAINGDFYIRDTPTYAGDPRGLQIINGELVSAPDTVCVWFDAGENPHLDEVKGLFYATWPDGRKTPFGLNQQRRANTAVLFTPAFGLSTRASGGRELILEKDGDSAWMPLQAGETYRARIREINNEGNAKLVPGTMILSVGPQLLGDLPEMAVGTVVQIATATSPDLKGVKSAIGGGPALVQNGKPAFTQVTAPPEVARDWSQRSKYERHPRSAIGWNDKFVFFVVVDGRQPQLSVGMKLAELAQFFKKLGCTEAMNLDGGKSSQLWFKNDTVNSPCQGVDTVANSILVIRKPK